MKNKKVVLMFSGGLDTSTICVWLKEKGHEVVTFTADVGQGDDLAAIEEKSKRLGAVKHITLDLRKEFVEKYVFPAIKANALYQGVYPLATSLARPLIAQKVVGIAEAEGAGAVAHGCTGKGNDQVRFDVITKSLAPELEVLAPVRDWNMGRDEEKKYAAAHGVEIPSSAKYSVDQNLWGRSIECGPLENPENEPEEDAYEWTAPIEKTPDAPAYLEITFEKGIPIKLEADKTLAEPLEMIFYLNQLAGKHGIGRIDHMEDRVVGLKSREVYEAPAATVLIKAHQDLEKYVCTRHENFFKAGVEREWCWLVYSGLWSDPLTVALNSFTDKINEKVSGTVRLKLFKGNATVVGRKSSNALYDLNLSTYNVDSKFDQTNSKGFIELWGLQTRMANALKRSG